MGGCHQRGTKGGGLNDTSIMTLRFNLRGKTVDIHYHSLNIYIYIYTHIQLHNLDVQSTSRETLGWKRHKLESRLPGEIAITSDMQMTPPLWQKVKRN